jgi:hypothetical protein
MNKHKITEFDLNELKGIVKILESAYVKDEIDSSLNPDLTYYPTRLGRLLGNVSIAKTFLKLIIESIETENKLNNG